LQVFAGESGRMVQHDREAFRRRFWQVVQAQFIFALAWMIPVNVLAAWAVPMLFGAAWSAATPFLHALSPAFVALAVLHPVSNTLQILDRQALAALWTGLRLALLVLTAAIAWRMNLSPEAAAWACSAVQIAVSLGLLASMVRCIRGAGSAPRAASGPKRGVHVISLTQ